MAKWNAIPVEQQEGIIGRTKLDDIELDDSVKPTFAHNALTTIVEDGEEIDIVRDNMPFGNTAKGEYGTYFIGYARSPGTIELMLTNMFVGLPPGNYDRLLDVSTAITGSLFFVPSMPLLESLADDPADGGPDAASTDAASTDAASTDQANQDQGSPDQGSPDDGSTDAGGDRPAGPPAPSDSAGSLGIGSLRGVTQHG
jgi:putative iron-dependent peroxidase